jgi:hypothetical protein
MSVDGSLVVEAVEYSKEEGGVPQDLRRISKRHFSKCGAGKKG